MRTKEEVERAVKEYADMVKRICLVYVKNYDDMEDIFQDVFLKYALFSESFLSQEHEKAWLIRVTVNRCKDILKGFCRNHVCSLEEVKDLAAKEDERDSEVFHAVLRLPEKYKIVIYLFYYEGYSAVEIARMLKKRKNTVYTNLSRGKKELKKMLSSEINLP